MKLVTNTQMTKGGVVQGRNSSRNENRSGRLELREADGRGP